MSDQTWPPPVDEVTEWDEVLISNGYGRAPSKVRVRWVMLWGQQVQINDRHEVWCTYCGGVFHTTAKLGHPFNGCPTGLLRRGGLVTVEDTTVDDEPRYLPVSEWFGARW